MLDHDHRVAEIAQVAERAQQARIVPLVQADRRLVEYIEYPRQPGADLRREADALAFAARKRPRRAREAEIFEAHIDEEAEAEFDFAQDARGDLALRSRQFRARLGEPRRRVADRPFRDLADMRARDLDCERLRFQAKAAATLAPRFGLVSRELLPQPRILGFAIAALQIGQNTLERPRRGVASQPVVVMHGDRLAARPAQNRVADGRRQRPPRLGHAHPVMCGEAFQCLPVIGSARARPWPHRALGEAPLFVGHDERGVEPGEDSQPRALRACAVRVVERKQPRLDFIDGESRNRTGKPRGEGGKPAVARVLGDEQPVREFERGFDGIGEAVAQPLAHHQPIDDDLDVVLAILVERGDIVDGVKRAVDLQPLEAALHQLGDLLAILALAPADHRRQQMQPRSLGHLHDRIDHLADRKAFDRQARRRRVGDSHPRPQEPHIVVDLGHRADRRTRVARRGLLVDGDGRRQPLDGIDVGLLHELEELPRIRRQAFDIAPLAFGVDGVERQRRLARPRQPGDDDQPVPRQVDVDALEVMLAGAADGDALLHDPPEYRRSGPASASFREASDAAIIPRERGTGGRASRHGWQR